ncbi:uncharacterized protein DUF3169 [Desulfobotulus alkaliphilus]|uniref:Uncharacterized protein DUF3169 n=1 Tax=Desulfobotulus alkaliphilus TaxID=622671 RepID=A0A562S3H8_9BACT|nr:DUF3169 family protein [Desulfobotulus alkaliphilus]TWI75324.1 uncharacterized protein DUF3169 [Desulfobotulus alkaliphilus]
MKSSKMTGAIGKLATAMIFGAALGMAAMLGLLRFIESPVMASLDGLRQGFLGHVFWFQIACPLLLGSSALYMLFKARNLLKNYSAHTDEEGEAFEMFFHRYSAGALLLTTFGFILNFILFGLSVDPLNPMIQQSIVLFILTCPVFALMELGAIFLIQKQDPVKKGDPMSFDFNRNWIESCDEAEQITIYKAAYKTFSFMKTALLIIFILTLYAKFAFDGGNLPIVFVGSIWLLQNMVFFANSEKPKKAGVPGIC